MKEIILLLTAVFCGFTNLKANDTTPNQGFALITSAGLIRQQILPNGVVLYDQILYEGIIDLEHYTSGLYLKAIGRTGLDRTKSHGIENEVDFIVGINRRFLDKFRFDLSGMYDHSIHMGSQTLEDLFRLGLKVGLDSKEVRRNIRISPYIAGYSYLCHPDSKHMENGNMWGFGIDLKTKIRPKIEFIFQPSLFWDDGFMNTRPGFVLGSMSGLNFEITRRCHLEVGYTAYISRQSSSSWDLRIAYRW